MSISIGVPMSSYEESWRESLNGHSTGGALPLEFSEAYPALSSILQGMPETTSGRVAVPPATVSIFADGGKLKFCISPKKGPSVAFGCLADPCKGLDDLELQLSQHRFEWRKGSRRMSS